MSATNDPVSMSVVLDGANDEVRLISALEQVMASFACLEHFGDGCGQMRAADWLYAKYGTPRRVAE